MPCYQPRVAWKIHGESRLRLTLSPPTPNATRLMVACNKCIGCHQTKAREWAYRCELELLDHDAAVFTTLTHEDIDIHPTLSKRLAQTFLKKLRDHHSRGPTANKLLRHFLSGEYGTHNKRPHYHAIIFGAHAEIHGPLIQKIWGLGFTYTTPVTPASIAYTAGYCAKKATWLQDTALKNLINPNTGELYDYQPEFHLMSRGNRNSPTPYGLGGAQRQHTNSWRTTAIYDGHPIPVPRYFHQAWKSANSPIDWHFLKHEKQQEIQKREQSGNYTEQRIQAALLIAEHKQKTKYNERTI